MWALIRGAAQGHAENADDHPLIGYGNATTEGEKFPNRAEKLQQEATLQKTLTRFFSCQLPYLIGSGGRSLCPPTQSWGDACFLTSMVEGAEAEEFKCVSRNLPKMRLVERPLLS